jgi:hypothetical protein
MAACRRDLLVDAECSRRDALRLPENDPARAALLAYAEECLALAAKGNTLDRWGMLRIENEEGVQS